MKRNAAEYIFKEVLSEFPVIEKNGIVHSDEYYEALIEDTNLSDSEKLEALNNVCQRVEKEVENLEQERCKIVEEITPYDDEEFLSKAVEKEQRATFTYRTVWLTSVIFMITTFIIFVTPLNTVAKFSTPLVWLCLFSSLVLSYLIALAFSDKDGIYDAEEASFLARLDAKRLKIKEIDKSILDLKRVTKFAERVLKVEDDLKYK